MEVSAKSGLTVLCHFNGAAECTCMHCGDMFYHKSYRQPNLAYGAYFACTLLKIWRLTVQLHLNYSVRSALRIGLGYASFGPKTILKHFVHGLNFFTSVLLLNVGHWSVECTLSPYFVR
jgi:hypothetical protein